MKRQYNLKLKTSIICVMRKLIKKKNKLFQKIKIYVYVSLLQFSHSVLSDSLWPYKPQHARTPCPLPTPGDHPNPCPSSRWCHPAISSSLVPFSSYPQSFSGSSRIFSNESVLLMRWPKYWSFSFSINPSNEYSGLISFRMDWLDPLQSKGLSSVFSNNTVQKHQFFSILLTLESKSHIHTWPLETPKLWRDRLCW